MGQESLVEAETAKYLSLFKQIPSVKTMWFSKYNLQRSLVNS